MLVPTEKKLSKIAGAIRVMSRSRREEFGAHMIKYLLRCVDETGHIVSSYDLVARDDLAALHEAEAASDRTIVEVWNGTRRVAEVKRGNAPLEELDRRSL